MTMQLTVNGVRYKHFTDASVTLRIDSLTDSFSFTSVHNNTNGVISLPFKLGDECQAVIDNEPVLTGYIEKIDGSYDSKEHVVQVQGRSKTSDLVDSSIGSLSDIGPPVTLKKIIENVISDIGSNISVVDNAIPNEFKESTDNIAPEPGDNAFSFIEELARNRQVLLTTNAEGNLVIEKTPGSDSGGVVQSVREAIYNNILSAEYSYDDTERFNQYQFVSELNPIALNSAGTISLGIIVNQQGFVSDTNVRTGRKLVLISESSFDDSDNSKRAEWEARVRRTRGRKYSCVVHGHRPDSGAPLWTPNTTVQVLDDMAGLSARMLINSVTYNLSEGSGSTTTLELVEKNAYNLQLQDPQNQKIGDGFV